MSKYGILNAVKYFLQYMFVICINNFIYIAHSSLSQDWHDLGPGGSIRSWPRDGDAGSPFKVGRVSPLCKLLPVQHDPAKIKVDLAHTYAICGFGKDQLASCIIFLSVHAKIWGAGTMENQLDAAYQSFLGYCIRHKKTTSITEFSKQELKIKSFLLVLFSIPFLYDIKIDLFRGPNSYTYLTKHRCAQVEGVSSWSWQRF